jgi:ribosome-associated toxin RatA of RatAB toxin-antitoxin module
LEVFMRTRQPALTAPFVALLLASMLLVTLSGSAPAVAADAGTPHEHRGRLKPYPSNPPALQLSAADQAILASGKPVMRQTEGEAGGRGLAVFVVDAPVELVWKTIQDFPSYPSFIPEVKSCAVYRKAGRQTDVAFGLKSFGVSIDYFIRHDFDNAAHVGTWTLDYDRKSDLDDSVGFWRVTPLPDDPARSRVEYSVDIALKGWVPGFVRGILVDNGVKAATSWVKVHSEQRLAASRTATATP